MTSASSLALRRSDWPILTDPLSDRELAKARDDAYERVRRDLADACEVHAVGRWLAARQNAADGLRTDLLRCLVAADCWNARLPYLSGTALSRPAGQRYLQRRMAAARAAWPDMLARWAVLACIPVRWIREAAVHFDMEARMRDAGLDCSVATLELRPPVTGGAEWVRRDCPDGIEATTSRARKAAVAAILHWTGHTSPAVVLAVGDALSAFEPSGRTHPIGGEPQNGEELIAAEPLEGDCPPVPWYLRLARLLGLASWIWKFVRWRRAGRGGGALDPHR